MTEKYGICLVGFYPLRREPDHRSECTTVMVFGETFEILEQKEKWFYIGTSFDNYMGWVAGNEIRLCDEATFKQINDDPVYHYSNELYQQVKGANKTIMVALGSHIPLWNGEKFYIGQEEYSIKGEVIPADHQHKKYFTIVQATKMLGVPYLWGGKNSFGVDCSGFVQTIYKFLDIKLPRNANQQVGVGEAIPFEACETGDLAFFKDNDDITVHVGIVSGNNSIIHASGRVRIDMFDEQGIYNQDLKEYTHQLQVIKRVI